MVQSLRFVVLLWPYLLVLGLSSVGLVADELRTSAVERMHLEYIDDRDFACWVDAPPEVLFMGSSMLRFGVNPSIVARRNGLAPGKVINVSANGATPLQVYTTYVRHEARLKFAKHFFYSIEPWIFNDRYYKFVPNERIIWNLAQWREMSSSLEISGSYFLPWKRFLLAFTAPPSEHACEFDQGASFGYDTHAPASALPIDPFFLEAYGDTDHFGPSTVQIRFLGRLKERVESNGAQFTVLVTPKYERYNSIYARYPEYANAFYEKLLAELGPEQRVLGRSVDPDFSSSPRLYFDVVHLATPGAIRFSRRINLARLSELPTLGSLRPGL